MISLEDVMSVLKNLVPKNDIVAAEPSLRTPHYQQKTSSAWFYSNATPSAATWYTVTFTGFPAGATALMVYAEITTAAVGYSDHLRWRPYNNGDTYANSWHRTLVRGRGNSGWSSSYGASGIVVIDASGRVDFAIGDANSDINIANWVHYFL